KLSARPNLFAMGDYSDYEYGMLIDTAYYGLGFLGRNSENIQPLTVPEPISATDYIHRDLPSGKSSEAAGIARVYTGPVLETAADVAMANLVGSAIHPEVFNINRSERGLGYVHGAALGSIEKRAMLYFYGQVEHTDRIVEAEDGWHTAIEKLRSGQIDDETWEQYRQGFLAQLNARPSSQLAELDRVMSDFEVRGDVKWREKIIKAVEEFDPSGAPSFIDQFVAENGGAFSQLEIRACARELGSK
ncbi:MAG: hypothetical protein AAF202_06030, partial [Pseudomonadota bacterium]